MNKTSITLTWDSNGRIKHEITGFTLPSPRNDSKLWILAPSVPLYVAHQLGVLKPSYGLFLCSQIIDISFHSKFVLAPINKTLKSAKIELYYKDNGSLGLKFFPSHKLIHNNDSLEEGIRQLIANYYYYVYNMLTYNYQVLLRSFVLGVVSAYCSLLEGALSANAIGPNMDRWDIEFPKWSQIIISSTSSSYYVPKNGQTDWVNEMEKKHLGMKQELVNRHESICKRMGIM